MGELYLKSYCNSLLVNNIGILFRCRYLDIEYTFQVNNEKLSALTATELLLGLDITSPTPTMLLAIRLESLRKLTTRTHSRALPVKHIYRNHD